MTKSHFHSRLYKSKHVVGRRAGGRTADKIRNVFIQPSPMPFSYFPNCSVQRFSLAAPNKGLFFISNSSYFDERLTDWLTVFGCMDARNPSHGDGAARLTSLQGVVVLGLSLCRHRRRRPFRRPRRLIHWYSIIDNTR